MKRAYFITFAAFGVFLGMADLFGQFSSGAYVEGDYLLHPDILYYKEEKVFIAAQAYLAKAEGKGWKTAFAWKGGEKEEKKENEIILTCSNEWPDAKGNRIKTLTPEGLAVEFKIQTEKGLGKGGHGLIAFYIPVEFLHEKSDSLICVSPKDKEIDISEKFKDIVLSPKQNKGRFILRGEKRELIIDVEGVDFSGSYGARIQDFKSKPKDGAQCLRFVISFNALKPLDINVKVSFKVKELRQKKKLKSELAPSL